MSGGSPGERGGLELSGVVAARSCPSLVQGEGHAQHLQAGQRVFFADALGYPSWELCLQCTADAGRGLILPIVSKEPLSDKKLKQQDYLGSMICPILQLLPNTTSARPGDAGNQGIPRKKMVQTILPEAAQRGGLCGKAPPSEEAPCPQPQRDPGPRRVLHRSCVSGQGCICKASAGKGNRRNAPG